MNLVLETVVMEGWGICGELWLTFGDKFIRIRCK